MAWAGKGQLASISPRVLTSKIKQAKSPSEIIAIIELHASDFNEIHSATCLYELAKRRRLLRREDTQSSILQDLIDFMDYQTMQMDPFSLSNSAWSVAQLQPLMGEHVTTVMPSIAGNSILTIGKFTPRDMSNLAWAFATLQIRNLPLFQAIAPMIVQQIEGCDAQDLSNLAWSFAKLGIHDAAFMDAIAKKAVTTIGTFTPQNLSNLAWSFAKLATRNSVLMDAIAQRVVASIGRFGGQALSTVAWSFAMLGIRNVTLLDAIGKEAVDIIGTFTHQGLGFLAYSYRKLGIRNPSLMRRICSRMAKTSAGQQPASDSVFQWAVVVAAAVDVGVADSELFMACARCLLQPGHLSRASAYSISALLRSVRQDDWQTQEPRLYQALKAEFAKRNIPQAALDSELMVDPARWTEVFG